MTRPLALVVCSGGMDSTTLAAHYAANYDLLLLSFDYGQRHVRELDSARAVAAHYGAEHRVVDLRAAGALLSGSALTDSAVPVPDGHYTHESMRATVVPNRNAIMANIAIGVGSARMAELVALGVHAGDHAIYPDCRPEFFDALRACAVVALDGFHCPAVETPFISLSKTNIATYAAELGAPLHLSWSCYKGGDVHCGTCGTCVERRESFHDARIPDPTAYLVAA